MENGFLTLIEIIKYLTAVLLGILLGNAAVYFFNKMPPEWFCDYGEKPTKEMISADSQRIKSHPWKYIFSMLFVAIGLYLVREDWMYALATVLIMWIMIELTLSDVKYRIVPDQLLILLAVSAIGLFEYRGWKDMLIGAAVGFGVMGAMALLGMMAYKRESIGGGDIKLFAALGLIAGMRGIIAIFIMTSLISAAHMVYLLARKKIKRHDKLPMVPYITIATGIYLIFLHTYVDEFMLSL